MVVEAERIGSEVVKKIGRRKKSEVRQYKLNKEQTRFVVEFKRDNKSLAKVQEILVKANKKTLGREINFTDVVTYLINKLGIKDIEKMQEKSLSAKDKLMRDHRRYQEKTGKNIEFWDYLELNLKK